MVQVKCLLPAAESRLETIKADTRLMDAARLFRESRVGLIVVCGENDKLAGVISKTDIVTRMSICTGHSCQMAAAEVMTRDVYTCRADQWLEEAWPMFKRHSLTNLPVIDQDSIPVGILNVGDALHTLLQQVRDEEALLRDYVMGVGYR